MARLHAKMQSDFGKFYLLLISSRLHLGCLAPILHAIRSTKTGFFPSSRLAFWLPEVSGSAPRFPWMVKGTPDAGKSSRTCDLDAQAADRRSRLPIDEPEPR